MKQFIQTFHFLLLAVCCMTLFACQETEDDGVTQTYHRETVKVAVVLPMDASMDKHWQQTLNWAVQNIETAQRNIENGVRLELEWYDENTIDIDETFSELSAREEIAAVIGPFYSAHTQTAALQCARYNKPLFTLSSSAELIRKFSEEGFLWALTETDISQCEVLLTKARMYGAKNVALLAQNDIYGQTFIDWFAFQAKELGLNAVGIVLYTDKNVAESFEQCAALKADFMICVPSSVQNLRDMITARKESEGLTSRLLYSDVAFNASVLEMGTDAEGMEGIAMSPDPASGFQVSYEVKFKEQPLLGEAHIYDAAMLIAYASFKMQTDSISDMNEALRILVNGRETNIGSWMPEDMELVFQALLNGKSPDIDGATGSLEFDEKVYTNVLHSVYANWMVYEGKFLILDYNTSDGGKRTEETLAGWNWKNSQIQDFDPNQGSYNYPELQEQWAVLIAASQGWDNYRHQADVLEVYRILKKHGFTDDHIIMIMADDIAYNPQNPEPGIVRVRPDGENLYENIQIDYLLSDLSPDDLQNILEGKGSERLTQVVPPSEHNNIFLFWSGHGEPGEMLWRNDESLTEAEMRAMLNKLNEQRVYRKMLWMVETCYSGSVAKAAEGIPGILFITAADENETSKADFFSNKLRVWMSNRFTATFQERISENPAISLRDLYYSLFQNTVGSHVMVYNNTHFDNIYQSYMDEFIQRK